MKLSVKTASQIAKSGTAEQINRLIDEHPEHVVNRAVQPHLAHGDDAAKSKLLDRHLHELNNETKELITYYGSQEHRMKLARDQNQTPFQQKILAKYGDTEVHDELLKQPHVDQQALCTIADKGIDRQIDTILNNHTTKGMSWPLKDSIYNNGSNRHRKILVDKYGWDAEKAPEEIMRDEAKRMAKLTYGHK